MRFICVELKEKIDRNLAEVINYELRNMISLRLLFSIYNSFAGCTNVITRRATD